jgi:hypothetical protein
VGSRRGVGVVARPAAGLRACEAANNSKSNRNNKNNPIDAQVLTGALHIGIAVITGTAVSPHILFVKALRFDRILCRIEILATRCEYS